MTRRPLRKPWFVVGVSCLLLFSVLWVWHVGHRGLFVLDESIMFDGAWRIAQGQVPYRDFYLPFGPVAFVLPGLAFRLFGVSFSSLVGVACVLSLLGTAVALRVTWRLTGSSWLSLLAGALTAIWFQAPFGVPWMEQTAFLFDLLALGAFVESRAAPRAELLLLAFAGVCSALAVLSKQNAGGLFVPILAGCLLLPWRGRVSLRALAAYGAGAVTCAVAFGVWLAIFSDVAAFRHYWIVVSSETGLHRIEAWKLVGTAFFQTLVSSSVPLFLLASLVGTVALCWPRRDEEPLHSQLLLSAWLALSLPQFHNAFQLTTNNDAPNNNVFVGICLAVTLSLVGRAREHLLSASPDGALETTLKQIVRAWPMRIAGVALAGLILYSAGDGLMIGQSRQVQEFFGARFDQRLAIAGASRVFWGEPTRITPHFCGVLGDMCKLSGEVADAEHAGQFLQRSDFERIARELQTRKQNFFVFPDTTMLYGLCGRVSPQPLLYFHPGQSFLLSDREKLDRQIVDSLERNHVELVVLERASFMGTHKQLASFPKLRAWIDTEFEPELELGNYRLLRRRTGVPIAVAPR